MRGHLLGVFEELGTLEIEGDAGRAEGVAAELVALWSTNIIVGVPRARAANVLHTGVTEDEIQSILNRVLTWPHDWQQQLAEPTLKNEAELEGAAYHAVLDELAAIDEGLTGEAARDAAIDAAFATLQHSVIDCPEDGVQR